MSPDGGKEEVEAEMMMILELEVGSSQLEEAVLGINRATWRCFFAEAGMFVVLSCFLFPVCGKAAPKALFIKAMANRPTK